MRVDLNTASIVRLYQSGLSINQIATRKKCSYKAIRDRLVAAKQPLRPNSFRIGLIRRINAKLKARQSGCENNPDTNPTSPEDVS